MRSDSLPIGWRTLALLVLAAAACSSSPSPATALRRSYGIPDGAKKVIVFGQNAHMDVDWLETTPAYFHDEASKIFDGAIAAMQADPDYRYSTAEMAYLQLYWNANPDKQAVIAQLIKEGRWQIVGGGVSSPDVLLPRGENLLRDFSTGTNWVRSFGGDRTRAAWLPDDFGLGPTTPDLLRAAGYDSVAFWRVDGNPDTPSQDAGVGDFASIGTTPGTSAAELADAGVTDFIWEGEGGSRVFAHWLRYSYSFGDYIDYGHILLRFPLTPLGTVLTDPEAINDNIQEFVNIVEPVSATDYMFVPVGGDFQLPKANLAQYMRDWNRLRYPKTGIWATDLTFADFSSLALTQIDRLPVRKGDYTTYWTGFYGSRPQLKEWARRGADLLTSAEGVLAALGSSAATLLPDAASRVASLSWTAGRMNHHDYITGTSPVPTAETEQIPESRAFFDGGTNLLADALRALPIGVSDAGDPSGRYATVVVWNASSFARDALVAVEDGNLTTASEVRAIADDGGTRKTARMADGKLLLRASVPAFGYRAYDLATGASDAGASAPFTTSCLDGNGAAIDCAQAATARVETDRLTATFSRAKSFAMSSLVWKGTDGGATELLAGPANDLVTFTDEGGLYSFGSESGASCGWGETARSSSGDPTSATIAFVADSTLQLSVVVTSPLGSGTATRTVRFGNGDAIEFETQLTPPTETSISARFPLALSFDTATMDAPFGIVTRTSIRDAHTPTFHPVGEWIDFTDRARPLSVSLSASANPAVSFSTSGQVDLIIARNVGFDGQCGTSTGGGSDDTMGAIDVRYTLVPHGPLADPSAVYPLVADAVRPLTAALVQPSGTSGRARSLASVDASNVFVTSVAQASDGKGWLVRLYRPGTIAKQITLTLDLSPIVSVALVDASGAALRSSAVDAEAVPAPTLVNPHTVSLKLVRPVETLLLRPAAAN